MLQSSVVDIFRIVVVKSDAVFFSERGVFIVFRARRSIYATKSQIERTGTSLLEFSRFFKAAMTTLLHGRAPNLER